MDKKFDLFPLNQYFNSKPIRETQELAWLK